MNAKSPSLGLNRLAFPFASLASAMILLDLHRQGYATGELLGYAAILLLVLFEYRR